MGERNMGEDGHANPRSPVAAPARIASARAGLERHRRENPLREITDADIVAALDESRLDYFMTTSLYWDCQCREDYQRPAGMAMCENCEAFRDESADSRINELRASGIHVDLTDPGVRLTLEPHGSMRE